MKPKNVVILVFATVLFSLYVLPFLLTHYILFAYLLVGAYSVYVAYRAEKDEEDFSFWQSLVGYFFLVISWPILVPIIWFTEFEAEEVYFQKAFKNYAKKDIHRALQTNKYTYQWPIVKKKKTSKK